MNKIMKVAFVAVFAAMAGYGVYANQKADTISDIMLANVEALASGESGCHYANGYVAFTSDGGGAYDCCNIWVNRHPDTNEGHCH